MSGFVFRNGPRLRIFVCLLLVSLWTSVDCVKYSSKYKNGDFLDRITVKSKHSDIDRSETSDNTRESVEDLWPVKIFNCVGYSGVEKCLKIFLIKRMDRIVDLLNKERSRANVDVTFDLVSEIKNDFKWEEYKKSTDKELDDIIVKNMKGVFKNKNTKLVLHPGIEVDVSPTKNGSFELNIKKDPELELSRGMKFPKKMFYRIIPMLLIPPLIMSAILPFVLPAMKIMILWVGLINQMALGGAVFTLLRNNAFSETTHHKKIIYVNDGYKNEKKPPPPVFHHPHHEKPHFPVTHFSQVSHSPPSFPHLTTSGYDEDFDDETPEFSEGGPVHYSKGNFGNVRPHFDEEEYDRTSHRYRSDFSNPYVNRGRPHNG